MTFKALRIFIFSVLEMTSLTYESVITKDLRLSLYL